MSARMMTIVTERLAESLVVASHYFGWSLADVVVTAARKALSTHPKHTMWPPAAVKMMKSVLTDWKEYEVYSTATKKLDQSIIALKSSGVDFAEELRTLKVLQTRVTKVRLEYAYAFQHFYSSSSSPEDCYTCHEVLDSFPSVSFV